MLNDRAPQLPSDSATLAEEQAWVARISASDHAAFKALYDRFGETMFAFAYSSLRSRDEAHDVVHDVFLSVWQTRARWQLTTSLRAYLMRAVHNKVATMRRHLRVQLSAQETMVRDAQSAGQWRFRDAADADLNERELAEAL